MHDQKELWNNAHRDAALKPHSQAQTDFAEAINAVLQPASKLLELGCGEANDSVYFAAQGHDVTATDFSDVVIAQHQAAYSQPNLHFEQLDIGQPFPYADATFDAVYARLSLHYFTDAVTRQAFAEIARVLKPGGKLCFMCKSVDDRLYGKGIEIEPNMFELDGHVRHFFSVEYAAGLLTKDFTSDSIETGQEEMYGKVSGFVKVIATKN